MLDAPRRPALYAPMLRRWGAFGVALAPDAGEGAGGGGAGVAALPAAGGDPDAAAFNAAVQREVNKANGDAAEIAAKLLRERGRKDQRIGELEEQVERAKVPKNGRVLTAQEAAEFDAYKALGKPPAEITAELAAGAEAGKKLADAEQAKNYEEAATALGWKGGLLKTYAGHAEHGFVVEWREEVDPEDASKRVRVPYAKPKAEGAPPVKLAEYVGTAFGADAADSIKAGTAPAVSTTSTTPGTAPGAAAVAPRGPQFTPQAGGSTAPKADDPVARRLAAREQAAAARPNPFARSAAGVGLTGACVGVPVAGGSTAGSAA